MLESLGTAYSQGELSDVIWKRADTPITGVPRPTDGHGWTVNDVGEIMPVWYEGRCLPNILVDDESVLGVDEPDDEYKDDNPSLG